MASAMEVKFLFYYFHLPLSSSQKSTLLSWEAGFWIHVHFGFIAMLFALHYTAFYTKVLFGETLSRE